MEHTYRSSLEADKIRYENVNDMPKFQIFMRKKQESSNQIAAFIYKVLFVYFRNKALIEMSSDISIGGGVYFGHPFCITINSKTIIGCNCNIHKGVTIGQENRGKRKGTPVIGNEVWIGINATIVGAVKIGDDVLIAPNSYVNCDVPSHSVVYGSPCIIKPARHATIDYISRKA